MSKEITYEPINFRRISDISNSNNINKVHKERRNVELLSDVVMSGTAHKRKMFRYIRNTLVVAVVASVAVGCKKLDFSRVFRGF